MAKKPAAPPAPEHIEAASKSNSIKHLVWLADAFHRVGSRGPIQTKMPQLVSGIVKDKGFRKFNLELGTWLECDSMRVGARDGLLFRFRPKNHLQRKSSRGELDVIDGIELNWSDVCDLFESLADDIEARILEVRHVTLRIDDLDKELRSVIQKNKQMHPIITAGFEKAQSLAKNQANDAVLEHIEGYGMF